jgi:hypothetical protein
MAFKRSHNSLINHCHGLTPTASNVKVKLKSATYVLVSDSSATFSSSFIIETERFCRIKNAKCVNGIVSISIILLMKTNLISESLKVKGI